MSPLAQVYTWGHNRVGQLGYTNNEEVPRNNEGAHFLPTPRRVKTLTGGGPPLRIQKVERERGEGRRGSKGDCLRPTME
jgi:hypothetical protein